LGPDNLRFSLLSDPLGRVLARRYFGLAGPALAEYYDYLARDLDSLYRITRWSRAVNADDTMEMERAALSRLRTAFFGGTLRSDLWPVELYRLSKVDRILHFLELLQAGRESSTELLRAKEKPEKPPADRLAGLYRKAIADANASAGYAEELIAADVGLLDAPSANPGARRRQAQLWQEELEALTAEKGK